MPAYLTVRFNPLDPEKLQQYGAAVAATLARHSGEVLAKGPAEHLHGNSGYGMQVILAFPSRDAALAWYRSDEYQALIPTRDAGMDSQFQLVG